MNLASLKKLLKDLRAISLRPEEKESESEILLDFLEIVAVASGKTPAHPQGQGMRIESLMDGIESTATRHGIYSLHTHPILEFWPRPPNYERAFFEWQREQDRREKEQQPSILWIFKDPELEEVIGRTVSGEIDVTAALAYPGCCVRYDDERHIQLSEMLVKGFKRDHGAKSVEDLIRLTEDNAKVPMDSPNPALRIRWSTAKFAIVQFYACDNCLRTSDSPAARASLEMKKLARMLSPFFHDKIENLVHRNVLIFV